MAKTTHLGVSSDCLAAAATLATAALTALCVGGCAYV